MVTAAFVGVNNVPVRLRGEESDVARITFLYPSLQPCSVPEEGLLIDISGAEERFRGSFKRWYTD